MASQFLLPELKTKEDINSATGKTNRLVVILVHDPSSMAAFQ